MELAQNAVKNITSVHGGGITEKLVPKEVLLHKAQMAVILCSVALFVSLHGHREIALKTVKSYGERGLLRYQVHLIAMGNRGVTVMELVLIVDSLIRYVVMTVIRMIVCVTIPLPPVQEIPTPVRSTIVQPVDNPLVTIGEVGIGLSVTLLVGHDLVTHNLV